jgi:hypothetical protein
VISAAEAVQKAGTAKREPVAYFCQVVGDEASKAGASATRVKHLLSAAQTAPRPTPGFKASPYAQEIAKSLTKRNTHERLR